MNEYDVRRYAWILSIQAEIEAMKLRNQQVGPEQVQSMGYPPDEFFKKAEQLRNLAISHNEQL